MEDYQHGQRIRKYSVEGLLNREWQELCKGQSIGRKKIDYFPEVETSKIRLTVTKSVQQPLIRNFSAYFVENFTPPKKQAISAWSEWVTVFNWKKEMFSGDIEIKDPSGLII